MRLAKINNLLLTGIVLINSYVIGAPFAPRALFWWQSRNGNRQHALTNEVQTTQAKSTPKGQTQPQPNHIVIPSMLLDQPLFEGRDTYAELDKGIWHWPASSTPDKGGNTVFLGHRFTYTNPRGVFYFLNKIKPGDEIGLFWNNRKYVYRVDTVTEVPPTDTSIEAHSVEPRLTLFTCTPLWLPKDRLVIVASLETAR